MSAFERADVAFLAGPRKNLKTVLEGQEYFVHVKDVYQALDNSNFPAHIPSDNQTSSEQSSKPKQLETSFSVILIQANQNQTEEIA